MISLRFAPLFLATAFLATPTVGWAQNGGATPSEPAAEDAWGSKDGGVEPGTEETPVPASEVAPDPVVSTDPAPAEDRPPPATSSGAWINPWVSERAPNQDGQTGLRRITSADPGRSGDVDIGVQLRGFYAPDFLVPNTADANFFGAGAATLGFSLFDFVELSLATRFAANENAGVKPSTSYALGDLAASAKVGAGFGPVRVGGALRFAIPPAPDSILPDVQNISLRGMGLLTLDLYAAYGIPLRVHANGAYTFQADRFAPDGPRDLYYASTAPAHLSALARDQWFYDSASAGLGVEVPLPFVTPYLEVWGRSALFVRDDRGVGGAPYNFLSDPHVNVSPGVRITAAPGLNFDIGVDIGLLGTAGFLQPDVSKVVHGQPINPLWTAQVGVSYTFQPFYESAANPRASSASSAASSQTRRNAGSGKAGATSTTASTSMDAAPGVALGCIEDGDSRTRVEDAIVEFVGTPLPRLATKSDGCFRLEQVPTDGLDAEIRHPDYSPQTVRLTTDGTAEAASIALVALPRKGTFKGFITDEKDENVDATIELVGEGDDPILLDAKDGTFSLAMEPGSYQAVVKAEGYLQQGAKVVVEKNGRTIRNFVLKRIPKKRISEIKKGQIAIATRIPFAYSKARLLRAAEFILDDVVDVILSNPQLKKIRIEGHTDNTGDDTYNQQLSNDRADAVRDYLIDKGVPADRLEAKGYGSKKPIARNDKESGRAKNRRVDFVIVDESSAATSP